METRAEKWKLYRQEILNDGLMLDKLANESSIIKEYKTKIDEINPKILDGVSTSSTLANLISIDLKDYSEIEKIREFANLIDEQKLSKISNEIKDYSSSTDFVSILNKDGTISEKWLLEDKNYVEISSNAPKLSNLATNWASFKIVSKDQIDKLDQLIKSKKTFDEFQNYKIIPLDEDNIETKPLKKVYLSSLVICLFFLITMIVLVVIKIIY